MPTLAAYRQYVARELGAFLSSTTAAVPLVSTTSLLADDAWPLASSLNQSALWQDAWLLRPSAAVPGDLVRLVATYTPGATRATLQPDRPWSIAPTASEAYELHTVVEPGTALPDLLNEALKRTRVVVEVTLVPTALQTRQSLAVALPWLTDPQDVLQVGLLSAGESRELLDPYQRVVRGEVVFDGAVPSLVTPGQTFLTTQTLYLRCTKRAYDHCAPSAGSYGSQSGLTLDTDKAPTQCELEWVGAAALVETWRRFAQVLETSTRARLGPNRQEAAARLTSLTRRHYLAHKPERTFRPIGYGGPRPARTGSAYRATTA